jgi:hypothetical protein
VDLSDAARVMAAEAAIDWPTLAAAAVSTPTMSFTLPGVPASVIDRTRAATRRAEAEAVLRVQLQETQSRLEEAYRVQLRAAARTLAADLRESLRERAGRASEESIAAIAAILESSAAVRAPKVVRLALLVGWPDDGKSDFVRFAARGAVEESWNEEADRLRQELEEHDAFVTARIDTVLSQFQGLVETERATNAQRIVAANREAEAQAATMARDRFAETARLTLPKLLGGGRSVLSGRSSTTLTIPGLEGEATRGDSPRPFPIPYDVLRSRLEIWLRIRGYKLAAGPSGGPDRTGEFIAWINHP